MKKYIILAMSALLFACNQHNNTEVADTEYASFGKKITPENALDQKAMLTQFQSMKPGDTAIVKFESKVNSVCQAKGCWMKLALNPDLETMVKFKDYEFFVPMDIADSDAIIEGKAFVEEMSVDDQKHYAQDAGKSETEIAAITEPKTIYRFEADGVLLK